MSYGAANSESEQKETGSQVPLKISEDDMDTIENLERASLMLGIVPFPVFSYARGMGKCILNEYGKEAIFIFIALILFFTFTPLGIFLGRLCFFFSVMAFLYNIGWERIQKFAKQGKEMFDAWREGKEEETKEGAV